MFEIKKRLFVMLLVIIFTFNINYKPVKAEPITLGLGLAYFAVATVACGVIYYSISDMEIAYNAYYDSLSFSDKIEFLNIARITLGNIFAGEKAKIEDVGLLNYIKEFFSEDDIVVPDSEYGSVIRDSFLSGDTISFTRPYPPDGLYTVTTVFNGHIYTVKARAYGPSYDEWGDWRLDHYINGVLLDDNYNFHAKVTFAKVVKQSDRLLFRLYYNTGSNVIKEVVLGLQGNRTLEGDKVNIVTNPYSYLYGDYYSPSDLTLDLPYVPGVTDIDDLDNIVFPGSIEDLLDRINEDTNFRDSILDRLLGLTNHDLANQSALDTHVNADGHIVVTPRDRTVPYFPDIPIDTPYEDTPVVDVPDHVGGIWGWLYQLLVSLLNVLKNILGSVGSLIGSLIKALLALLTNLFTLRYDIISEFTTDIQKILKNKLGTNVYLSMFNQVKNLNGIPIPRQYIGNVVVLETDYINNLATTLKSWQRWFYYILIALYNLNNVYKLIRGGEMISRSNKDK